MADNIDDLIPDKAPNSEPVHVDVELSSELYTDLAASLYGGPNVSVDQLIAIMLEEAWADVQSKDIDPPWFERVKARISG